MTTLTSATGACEVITARRAESIDAENIKKLQNASSDSLFGRVNLVNLIERAVLSVTIVNSKDEILAHGNFSDQLNVVIPKPAEWVSWLATNYDLPLCTTLNTLFLHFFVAKEGFSQGCAKEIVRTAFNALPDLHYIILAVPPGCYPEVSLTNVFEESEKVSDEILPCNIFVCMRHQHVPTLHIRDARVEDHDDLVPIFEKHSDMLTKTYGSFFLAELIEAQDENMKCIVAEVDGFAAGFMSLNTDINLPLLNECFELEPFNGLHKAHPDDVSPLSTPGTGSIKQHRHNGVEADGQASSRASSVQSFRSSTKDGGPAGSVKSKLSSSESPPATAPATPGIPDVKPALSNSQLGENSVHGLIDQSDQDSIKSDVRKRSMDESSNKHHQVGSKMQRPPTPRSREGTKKPPVYHGAGNAVSIQLFCVDEKYEMRSVDFLPAVFEKFPNLEYVFITIPHMVPEFPLLQQFVRVCPRVPSTLSQELYVYHRAGLRNDFFVRHTCNSDYPHVEKLVKSLHKHEHLLADLQKFNNARRDDNGTPIIAFVAHVNEQLIGVAIIRQEEDIEYIRSHYNIEDFIYYNHHRRDEHGHLYHFAINPIFRHYNRHFLKEILRLSRKTCLYYPIYPPYTEKPPCEEHTLIGCLGEMVPVRPRRQIIYPVDKLGRNAPSDRVLKKELPYALYHINRKLTLEPKVTINTRIVIVGASDTAMSYLETLAFCPHLHFHNLTLVSPHGLPGDLPPNIVRDNMIHKTYCFTQDELNQMSLRTWVNVVYGKMTSIDRKKKHIVVDGSSIVPYDHLVITTGVQYDYPAPTEADIAALATSGDSKYSPDRRYTMKPPRNVFVVNDTYDSAVAMNWIEENILNKSGDILIYGQSLDVYCCIQSLVDLGISGKRIILVEPPVTYQVTCFNNSTLEATVAQALMELGVRGYFGYILAQWNEGKGQEFIPMVQSASFTSSTKPITFECDAFLAYYKKMVDRHAFKAVNDACLVFDGRMVIDANFHTNDVSIRAAGPFTKYQRIYHVDQWTHSRFNSREIGIHLANVMLSLFDPSLEPEVQPPQDLLKLIPLYKSPKMQGGYLPGGFHYLHVQKPNLDTPMDTQMAYNDYGRVLKTGEPGSEVEYFRLHLNQYNSIQTITCLSKKLFPSSNLICLYSLHERYLNDLCSRFDEGLINDFYLYFQEPWCMVIFHDRFPDFREEVRELLTMSPGEGEESFEETVRRMLDDDDKLSPSVHQALAKRFDGADFKRNVETRLLSLLSYNYYHLPMYAKPGMV